MNDIEHHDYDVIVIGAGGAGLRAAIEAKQRGLRVALICKSLLGKAHTVMAEGGVAAAMGNVYEEDNWMVHFRDTMRGGKMLNHYRMAELHAKESPDRVHELEAWGALFDRTKDGKILQRDFGGHRYARLAHVGDRTGLELIRTLQQKAVSMDIDVFMECKVIRLLNGPDGSVTGAVAYWRPTGEFITFGSKAVVTQQFKHGQKDPDNLAAKIAAVKKLTEGNPARFPDLSTDSVNINGDRCFVVSDLGS